MSYGKLRYYLACVLAQGGVEDGQTLFEFTLVLALVALVAVAALTALGVVIGDFWEPVTSVMG